MLADKPTTSLGWPRAWLNDSSTLRSTGASGTQSRSSLRKRMRSHVGSARTLSTQSCRSQMPKKICSLHAITCRLNLTLVSLWGLWASLYVIGGWLVRSTLRTRVARCQTLLTCPWCCDLWKTNWWRDVLNFQSRSSRNPASSFFPSGPLSNSKLMATHPNVLQWISVPLPIKCSIWILCLFFGNPLNLCPRHLMHHKQHPISMNFPSFPTIYLYCLLRYSHPIYEKCPACFCCGNVVTDSSWSLGIGTGTGAIITRLPRCQWGEHMERAWMGHISPQIIQKILVRTFCRISSLRLLMSGTRAFADTVLVISSSATVKF